MNRATVIGIALLTCSALLAPDHACADPRGVAPPFEPPTPEELAARRLQKTVDMNVWLPRLVGRFRYEGMADFNAEPDQSDQSADPPDPLKMKSAKGMGDCIAIGTGVGVQCVINVVWDAEWGPQGQTVDGGLPFLAPALILYGIDPSAAAVRYLQLDTDGLVQDGPGQLKGDTLSWTYSTQCVQADNGVPPNCRRITRTYAPPDGKRIQVSIDIEKWMDAKWERVAAFSFDLRRVSQTDAGAASKAPTMRRKH